MLTGGIRRGPTGESRRRNYADARRRQQDGNVEHVVEEFDEVAARELEVAHHHCHEGAKIRSQRGLARRVGGASLRDLAATFARCRVDSDLVDLGPDRRELEMLDALRLANDVLLRQHRSAVAAFLGVVVLRRRDPLQGQQHPFGVSILPPCLLLTFGSLGRLGAPLVARRFVVARWWERAVERVQAEFRPQLCNLGTQDFDESAESRDLFVPWIGLRHDPV